MLTISKPLGAAQLRTYHAEEFSTAADNYYTAESQIRGQWHGQMAAQWGLVGAVQETPFQRLADGQHPGTGEPLVHHQTVRAYANQHGEPVSTMTHRAGWDATFSAPKSVSLTALVGGDERLREAHRASVAVALDEAERYVQARIGRNHPAETTGKWVAASFEHDSARPVDGYPAPQLHTHVVFFNVTERLSGETRAIQPRELYKSQQYLTAVYRSELAARLTALGYPIERGDSGQPEIQGYTAEYLDASSPRRQQIEAHLADAQQSGAAAAQIAAHRTREAKLSLSREAIQRRHCDLAQVFGDQPAQVVQAARGYQVEPHRPGISATDALAFAKERNFEREAVVDERSLLRDGLRRSMGDITVGTLRRELDRAITDGEFIGATQAVGTPGRAFTTPEMVGLERETIATMRAGRRTQPALVGGVTRHEVEQAHSQLSEPQRAAVEQILATHDRIVALEGVAGAGKTTALAAVRDGAKREGYRVEGLAPTSRAAHKLAESGIPSRTLQRHLILHEDAPDRRARLYVVDESSLASTKQMHDFLHRLRSDDRVLLVGDIRQHQAVEAGHPYQQLQEAGVETVRLDAIVRQPDAALRHVVEHLSRGEIRTAIEQLEQQGRVHEFPNREDRLAAIARAYVGDPDATLVVAPDHRSRGEINQRIHHALQDADHVDRQDHHTRVLVTRQEITSADRQWAEQYARGDIVRYTTGSRSVGLHRGEYAHVAHVNAPANQVTVVRPSGEHVTYDPRRLHGVTVFREAERAFSRGDRVQFTAPFRARHVANHELGTLEHINANGELRVRLDSGRTVAFTLKAYRHLDYGYAVTSHSSQGQTADRVLVDVDTAAVGEQLVNRRLAYVAVSRGRYDAQIYTNDKTQLGNALSRDVSHRAAIEAGHAPASRAQEQVVERSSAASHTANVAIAR